MNFFNYRSIGKIYGEKTWMAAWKWLWIKNEELIEPVRFSYEYHVTAAPFLLLSEIVNSREAIEMLCNLMS